MSKQSTLGELFSVLKNNEYAFRKGFARLVPVKELYDQGSTECIDYLKMLYKDANIVDKEIIKTIIREIRCKL